MLDQDGANFTAHPYDRKTGQSFKKRYFARLWDEAMKAAGLQQVELPGMRAPVDLHFHDLRGTSVTLLSEAGCGRLSRSQLSLVIR